ncbi:hypothetical protein FBQ87_07075 [Sphingobacteriales bacterium CHB3]|nr:hypothetical protein [Sphingobacteriales bacterium CHB3]
MRMFYLAGLVFALFFAVVSLRYGLEQQSLQTLLLSNQYTGYNILYVTGSSSESLLTQYQGQSTIGAQVLENFTDGITIDSGRAIDALVIDNASISMIDTARVAALYRQGTVISFVDGSSSELRSILGMTCRMAVADTDNLALTISRVLLATNESDMALLEENEARTCGYEIVQGILGPASFSVNSSALVISTPMDFAEFEMSLLSHINTVREERSAFYTEVSRAEQMGQ